MQVYNWYLRYTTLLQREEHDTRTHACCRLHNITSSPTFDAICSTTVL